MRFLDGLGLQSILSNFNSLLDEGSEASTSESARSHTAEMHIQSKVVLFLLHCTIDLSDQVFKD